jgi:hypothetical protein
MIVVKYNAVYRFFDCSLQVKMSVLNKWDEDSSKPLILGNLVYHSIS